jgi:hypothetical protein
MLLGFALFYFLTTKENLVFLKNKKEFLFKQVWEPSKSASVKTASNEIQKTQFDQRHEPGNQNSQFQNSQNS